MLTKRRIYTEKMPAIAVGIGTNHFRYGNGKIKREYIILIPFLSIHIETIKIPAEKERLKNKQQEAVRNKNYDEAALIRDEMKRKGMLS